MPGTLEDVFQNSHCAKQDAPLILTGTILCYGVILTARSRGDSLPKSNAQVTSNPVFVSVGVSAISSPAKSTYT